ncbi:hypothetical protein Cgig2_022677 [Carnegiea gigantea]|uniref:Uncharacterized protein n=1 Tax=Carnegiea gigantea TaxID=171969 RepID=A0A9Q1QGW2_9CARY|nr:hypothetical protein Cgig2_022677 [Carnegiea gigantea]
MTDTIMQQVFEQVKKAVEAASSTRPLTHFECIPATGCEPFHRHGRMLSHRHSEGMREALCADRNSQSRGENRDRSVGADALHNCRPRRGWPAKSTTASTPYATHSRRTAWFEEQEQTSKPRREALGQRRTLKRQFYCECTHSPPQDRHGQRQGSDRPVFEECSTVIVATIASGHAEGITRSASRGQLQGAQQVLTAE